MHLEAVKKKKTEICEIVQLGKGISICQYAKIGLC